MSALGDRDPRCGAEMLEDARRPSAEALARGEAAERAQALLDAADPRARRWELLRAEIAAALAVPAPPPATYSRPYADGQREMLKLVMGRMAALEEEVR